MEISVSFGFNKSSHLLGLDVRESSREEGKLGLALEIIWKSGLWKEQEQLGFRGHASL